MRGILGHTDRLPLTSGSSRNVRRALPFRSVLLSSPLQGKDRVIVSRVFSFFSRARSARMRDHDTELLRSELLSIEQLKRHAVTLAGQHRIDPGPGPDRLLPRLDDNEQVLLAAYDIVTATATPGQ